jgi:hypothetical protein
MNNDIICSRCGHSIELHILMYRGQLYCNHNTCGCEKFIYPLDYDHNSQILSFNDYEEFMENPQSNTADKVK